MSCPASATGLTAALLHFSDSAATQQLHPLFSYDHSLSIRQAVLLFNYSDTSSRAKHPAIPKPQNDLSRVPLTRCTQLTHISEDLCICDGAGFARDTSTLGERLSWSFFSPELLASSLVRNWSHSSSSRNITIVWYNQKFGDTNYIVDDKHTKPFDGLTLDEAMEDSDYPEAKRTILLATYELAKRECA